ncbi:hypothetical protein AB0C33_21830 [Nonomuraea sp. NPDC048881]|uniref:hypothetical protein n=1 Tax=Nonomuraea sp. NPDC048881 TaxID=3155030 RepID=UPI0033E90E7B
MAIVVVVLNDRFERSRRNIEWARQSNQLEADRLSGIYGDGITALRNYMHAMSDFADFRYRSANGSTAAVVFDENELVRRVLETDRAMIHQESAIRLASPDATAKYESVAKKLREIRRLIDYDDAGNGNDRSSFWPESSRWEAKYEEYEDLLMEFTRCAKEGLDAVRSNSLPYSGWRKFLGR